MKKYKERKRNEKKVDFIIAVSIIFAFLTMTLYITTISISQEIILSERFFYSFLMLYFSVIMGYFIAKYLSTKSTKD